MPTWMWTILLLLLIGALMYGAFWFGRTMASKENSTARSDAGNGTAPGADSQRDASGLGRRAPPRPTVPPPPALAGARDGQSGYQSATAPKRGAPPPAAAGGGSTGAASPHAQPKRTAAPPPAQAAWSAGKPDPAKKG